MHETRGRCHISAAGFVQQMHEIRAWDRHTPVCKRRQCLALCFDACALAQRGQLLCFARLLLFILVAAIIGFVGLLRSWKKYRTVGYSTRDLMVVLGRIVHLSTAPLIRLSKTCKAG